MAYIQLGFRNYFILKRFRFLTTEIFIGFASTVHKSFKIPGGYLHIKRSGGLDLISILEANFGARSGQVHQIRGKTWEVL